MKRSIGRNVRMRHLVVAAVLPVLVACGGSRESSEGESRARAALEEAGEGGVRVATGADDTLSLAGADVQITSTDGAITLAVLRDSVVMQLGDSVRRKVKREMDSSMRAATNEGGMGAALANVVGSAVSAAVNSAMGIKVHAPASSVTDLRYEDGRLHFKVKGDNVNISSDTRHDGDTHRDDKDGARFTEADARKFIAAVEAAKARTTAM